MSVCIAKFAKLRNFIFLFEYFFFCVFHLFGFVVIWLVPKDKNFCLGLLCIVGSKQGEGCGCDS